MLSVLHPDAFTKDAMRLTWAVVEANELPDPNQRIYKYNLYIYMYMI